VGSGLSTKQRPEFLHLREYALDPANGIKHIVFNDLDRFIRNIEEFFIYTKDLLRAGITLHLALDNEKFDYNSEEMVPEVDRRSGRIKEDFQEDQAGTAGSHQIGLPHRSRALGLQTRP
jgi:DNA invertase Pin-like site-specific DNA recombinase